MRKLYQFNPDPNITTYELAIVMKDLFITLINSMSNSYPNDYDDKLEIEEFTYNNLPTNIKRHFSEIKK